MRYNTRSITHSLILPMRTCLHSFKLFLVIGVAAAIGLPVLFSIVEKSAMPPALLFWGVTFLLCPLGVFVAYCHQAQKNVPKIARHILSASLISLILLHFGVIPYSIYYSAAAGGDSVWATPLTNPIFFLGTVVMTTVILCGAVYCIAGVAYLVAGFRRGFRFNPHPFIGRHGKKIAIIILLGAGIVALKPVREALFIFIVFVFFVPILQYVLFAYHVGGYFIALLFGGALIGYAGAFSVLIRNSSEDERGALLRTFVNTTFIFLVGVQFIWMWFMIALVLLWPLQSTSFLPFL